ncbi:glycosyltransferase family 2 protein [Nosocomiicoccus ampullae]|uniref:glycosyltransferase family 2 protein n=1 Tax=Nosocomiicoccus ampullae TaxID=489910 RepID=UPI001C5D7E46|nr:glycosyltransferase family 2 protein [Nosocomiicoccus ampullae]QYA48892.1 glycosyltransferase family 2 protein [Nosocomiicoccus ampullae]
MLELSIIMPLYNKEYSIEQSLNSIINLDIDHSNIEVIIIDDKSTDDSVNIVSKFLEDYDFFKLIELEENSGSPSTPRNVGITKAKGTYIALLDADDWLDSKGFPELLKQAIENDSDFAFGQAIKHSDKNISKIATFASYKKQNNLIPYEIEKIFRAVGPPGKIFKRSLIVNNDIKFKHLKYGEDKLFFIEAIALSKTASMNPTPVYHVNRYSRNVSLVQETSIIEKSYLNIEVLKDVILMNIPDSAKKEAISRIIEMDFLSRLFNRKRFLNSNNKKDYYKVFNIMMKVLDKNNLVADDYITDNSLGAILKLVTEKRYDDLIEFITITTGKQKSARFLKDNQSYMRLPTPLEDIEPVKDEIYAVYNGTSEMNGEFYEIINVYIDDVQRINKVLLCEISNEPIEKEVSYLVNDYRILIKTNDLNFDDYNFNIKIVYDNYKSVLVNASYPSANINYNLNRQHYKVEFTNHHSKNTHPSAKIKANYLTEVPESVEILKKCYVYNDVEFKEKPLKKLNKNDEIKVCDIMYTKKGTPRLVTKDKQFITANKEFVKIIE